MTEKVTFDLTGWKAIVFLILLVGFLGYRVTSYSDRTDDKQLVEEVEGVLMSIHYPRLYEKVRDAYMNDKSGKTDAVKTALSTKMNIETLQVSYPLFQFQSNKKVVVKVCYSMDDDSGTSEKGTVYYLFHHSSLMDHWSYQYTTTAVSYYLNFI